ncbi:hypothetical protein SISNIDRAFT_418124, partial [Sistotremastrum niveocremeum HHB9708]
ADSTLRIYDHGVRTYLDFCLREQIPADRILPADETVLAAFAATFAGRKSGSAAKNAVAAVRAWHLAQGFQWSVSPQVQQVIAGVQNLAPASSVRPPRPPITPQLLHILHQCLDLQRSFDRAVFAAALVAFWGQCRLGDFLPGSITVFERSRDPTFKHYFPARSHFRPSRRDPRSHIIFLPSTKTHQRDGESVILTEQVAPLDPSIAVRAILPAGLVSDSTVLHTQGRVLALSAGAFMTRCNEVWRLAGESTFTGHSFRIGGTTTFLVNGVPPDVVKAMGRWSSDAFLRYWRELESLAPEHAAHMPVGEGFTNTLGSQLRTSGLGGRAGTRVRRRERRLGPSGLGGESTTRLLATRG